MKKINQFAQVLSAALLTTILATNAARAATDLWVGNTDANFNTLTNWTGSVNPNGNTPQFGTAGSSGTTLNNDQTGSSFAGLTFNAGASAYTIGGNGFTLTGNITNNSTTNAQIINNAMDFTVQRTITTSNAAAGITLGGVLSGTGGSLVIVGPGAVTLSNASNSFNSGVTIGNGTGAANTGILRAAASGALGSGTVTTTGNASASRLELTSGITLSNAITLGGVASTTTSGIQNISGSNTLSGAIDLQSGGVEHQIQSDAGLLTLGTASATAITTTTTSARNVTLQGAGDGAVVGNIIDGTNGGTRAITVKKAGAGTWTLSGTNTYTGGTTINLGTILLGNNSALGSGAVSLGTGGIGSDSALLTNGAFAITGGKITVNGGGGGRVLGGNTANVSSFANNIDVGTGAFQVSQIAGGTLTLSGTINGTFGTSGLMTFTNQGTVNVNGNITNTVAGLQVTQSGAGTTTLSGTNSYTGKTTVTSGTLQFAKQTSLYNNTTASWTAANINVASGATLALNVGGTGEFTSSDLNTLLTNISVAGSATVGLQSGAKIAVNTTNAGGSFTQGNAIADSTGANGGAIGLTKLGTGTLVLDKTNTYTGVTTISGGTLLVNGSLASGSTVNVNSTGTLGGTTVGGGAANVAGTVNVNSGGTLAPGASIGQLNSGTVNASAGSTLAFELSPTTVTTDLLNITGDFNLALTNDAILTLTNVGGDSALTLGTVLTLVDYSGAWNGGLFNYLGSTLADNSTFTLGLNTYMADYNGVTAFTLTTVAVPEPSTYALLGMGLAGLFLLRRSARKKV